MEMIILKKIMTVFLCIVLIVCAVSTGTSANAGPDEEKITEALREEIDLHEPDDLIPVTIWFNDDVDHEANRVAAIEAVGMDPIAFDKLMESDEDIPVEIVDGYIMAKRNAEAESYQDYNERILSSIDYIDEIVYVSHYSPVVIANMTSDNIFELSANENLWFIDIYKTEVQDEMSIANAVTRVTEVHNASYYGYTGSGVKIGMVESNIPDSSILNNYTITIRPNTPIPSTSNHANAVFLIMYSIAPDATYYCAKLSQSENDTTYLGAIEWLIGQGVNVINASCRFGVDSDGYAGTTAKWVNHIACWDDVHFVKSAGDLGSSGITSPGMAYNAITVGGLDDNRTTSYTDDDVFVISSYQTSFTRCRKPDICAPCVGLSVSTYSGLNGTSYAAAQVTGIVALLCQQRVALKTKQDVMKAILASSINMTSYNSYVPSLPGYGYLGSGIVDAVGACFVNHNTRFKTGTIANGVTKTYTLNVYSSDTRIRVSLNWLGWVTLSNGHQSTNGLGFSDIADLELKIVTPSGSIIYGDSSIDTNCSIVDFEPSDYDGAGAYTIKITRHINNCNNTNIPFGVAWR
ncbi:MAG: S8/S53 family peptidase [Clostridia bacterium]|nr:S8/S53 family peptidase [Clostridia bacterium]